MIAIQYYFVYVLQSMKDGFFYVGFTRDLNKRMTEHDEGKVFSTKHRQPLVLVYYEGSLSQKDATRREKYLKTAWGKRYIKNRLKDNLTGYTHISTRTIGKIKSPLDSLVEELPREEKENKLYLPNTD